MNTLPEIWNGILTLLKEEITPTALDTWFSSAELLDLDSNNAVILAGNELACDVIRKRFEPQLKRAFGELFCQDFIIDVVWGKDVKETFTKQKEGRVGQRSFTIPAHRFGDFLIDDSNRFAYMVAKAVSDDPGNRDYNPLFIYGSSGIGKTHLLCSIGTAIHEKYPGKKITYISGENFTNRLTKAIRNNTTEKFREEFRMTDVLLIDDIQFIVGKKATQEEFYNTFNSLYEAGKHIVMTSDIPPREMPVLEDRLRTRFEGGIMASILPPSEKLRTDLIHAKSRELGVDLSDDEISLIASKPVASVRQIEGILKNVASRRKITGNCGLEMIYDILSGSIFEVNTAVRPEDIISEVSSSFDISVEEIKGPSRARRCSSARQISMYLMRTELGMRLEDIAELFKRDHATVVASVNRISKLTESSPEISDIIISIKQNIKSRAAEHTA